MTIRAIAAPLYDAKLWLKLVGVLMIIYGVLALIGLIFAVASFFVGDMAGLMGNMS